MCRFHLYQDTTDPSVNCPANSSAAIDLSSSGNANWTMTNLKVGEAQTIAAVGASSTLHLDSVDVQGYSFFAAGAPAFKVSSGADFSLGSSLLAAIRPASGTCAYGACGSAGNIMGPGLDSTQGFMQGLTVGGGQKSLEGAASLLGSGNTTSSGNVSFFTPSNSRIGYVGNGSSSGINLEADTGSIFLLPNNGANTMSVGSSGGKLIINVNGLPTSCSGLATGTLWDNAGVLQACP